MANRYEVAGATVTVDKFIPEDLRYYEGMLKKKQAEELAVLDAGEHSSKEIYGLTVDDLTLYKNQDKVSIPNPLSTQIQLASMERKALNDEFMAALEATGGRITPEVKELSTKIQKLATSQSKIINAGAKWNEAVKTYESQVKDYKGEYMDGNFLSTTANILSFKNDLAKGDLDANFNPGNVGKPFAIRDGLVKYLDQKATSTKVTGIDFSKIDYDEELKKYKYRSSESRETREGIEGLVNDYMSRPDVKEYLRNSGEYARLFANLSGVKDTDLSTTKTQARRVPNSNLYYSKTKGKFTANKSEAEQEPMSKLQEIYEEASLGERDLIRKYGIDVSTVDNHTETDALTSQNTDGGGKDDPFNSNKTIYTTTAAFVDKDWDEKVVPNDKGELKQTVYSVYKEGEGGSDVEQFNSPQSFVDNRPKYYDKTVSLGSGSSGGGILGGTSAFNNITKRIFLKPGDTAPIDPTTNKPYVVKDTTVDIAKGFAKEQEISPTAFFNNLQDEERALFQIAHPALLKKQQDGSTIVDPEYFKLIYGNRSSTSFKGYQPTAEAAKKIAEMIVNSSESAKMLVQLSDVATELGFGEGERDQTDVMPFADVIKKYKEIGKGSNIQVRADAVCMIANGKVFDTVTLFNGAIEEKNKVSASMRVYSNHTYETETSSEWQLLKKFDEVIEATKKNAKNSPVFIGKEFNGVLTADGHVAVYTKDNKIQSVEETRDIVQRRILAERKVALGVSTFTIGEANQINTNQRNVLEKQP